MNNKEHIRSERDEIIASLSKSERRILYNYEMEHGRLFPGAIYKVIQDHKELSREKTYQKKGKRR